MKFKLTLLVAALLAVIGWVAIRVVPGFAYEEPDAIGAAQTTPEDAGSRSAQNVGSEPEGALAARQRAEDSPVDDPCPSDCAAHAAGYAWAEERGISEPGECEGDSVAFVEGCRAYVEERLEQTLLGK
jgi:hypothetical protein